jgi:hypothetical protein
MTPDVHTVFKTGDEITVTNPAQFRLRDNTRVEADLREKISVGEIASTYMLLSYRSAL